MPKEIRRHRNSRTTELGVEQRCGRCREWLPADKQFFYARARRHNGLADMCKVCQDELSMRWRERNPARWAVTAERNKQILMAKQKAEREAKTSQQIATEHLAPSSRGTKAIE